MHPEKLKNIKAEDIVSGDTIFIPDYPEDLVEYKVLSNPKENNYWLEIDVIHVKSGLDDTLKFNPKAPNTIFRNYLGANWIKMG